MKNLLTTIVITILTMGMSYGQTNEDTIVKQCRTYLKDNLINPDGYVEYSFKKTPYTLKQSLIQEISDLRRDSNQIQMCVLLPYFYSKYDSLARVFIHEIDSLIKLKTLEINQLDKGLKENKVVRYDISLDYSSTNYYGGRVRKTDIVYYYPFTNNISQSKLRTITNYFIKLHVLSDISNNKGIQDIIDREQKRYQYFNEQFNKFNK
jgi:hypothetical protein